MGASWVLHGKKVELLRARPHTGSNKKRRVKLPYHDGLKEIMTKIILYIERYICIYVYRCI